jgi:hypothetical protein
LINILWNQEGSRATARFLPTQHTNIRKTRMSIRVPSRIPIHDPSVRTTNHTACLSTRVHNNGIFRKQKLHNSFTLKGYRTGKILHATYNKTLLYLRRLLCIWNSYKNNTSIHDRTPTQQVDKNIKINTVHRTTILMNEVTHT